MRLAEAQIDGLRARFNMTTYRIEASWDPEADVWVATSDDVPGLATEASTVEELTRKLKILVPELLEANGVVQQDASTVSFELTSHRHERIQLAS
jgi:predicted RNase H-like HicB family nuclease